LETAATVCASVERGLPQIAMAVPFLPLMEVRGIAGVFPKIIAVDDQKSPERLLEPAVKLVSLAGADRTHCSDCKQVLICSFAKPKRMLGGSVGR
jgi:hypothetical protein